MNKRIQKLYDQADKFATENRTQTISGPGNNYFELFHSNPADDHQHEGHGFKAHRNNDHLHVHHGHRHQDHAKHVERADWASDTVAVITAITLI